MIDYKELIKHHNPINPEEEATKKSMLQFIDRNDDCLNRSNLMGHLTASSVILNKDYTKMLMIHHKIYDTWAWTGGHADGEANMLKLALKEAQEETGLMHFEPVYIDNEVDKPIISLDILYVCPHIKKGVQIPPHMHLNVAYLFIADEEETLTVNQTETNGIKWVPVEEINDHSGEPEIYKIYHRLINEVKPNMEDY